MITSIRKNLITKKYEVIFELSKKNFLHNSKIIIFGDFNDWGKEFFELTEDKKERYKSKYIFPKQGIHGSYKTREVIIDLTPGTYQFKYYKYDETGGDWLGKAEIPSEDQDTALMKQFGVTWVGNGLGDENLVLTLH